MTQPLDPDGARAIDGLQGSAAPAPAPAFDSMSTQKLPPGSFDTQKLPAGANSTQKLATEQTITQRFAPDSTITTTPQRPTGDPTITQRMPTDTQKMPPAPDRTKTIKLPDQ